MTDQVFTEMPTAKHTSPEVDNDEKIEASISSMEGDQLKNLRHSTDEDPPNPSTMKVQ